MGGSLAGGIKAWQPRETHGAIGGISVREFTHIHQLCAVGPSLAVLSGPNRIHILEDFVAHMNEPVVIASRAEIQAAARVSELCVPAAVGVGGLGRLQYWQQGGDGRSHRAVAFNTGVML